MIVLVISIVFTAIFVVMAVQANARFRHHDRLPMQWSLGGTVNWTAPRVFALSLIPALGISLLMFITLLNLNVAPRIGQEGMVLPVTILLGAIFVLVQLLHVWLIDKTVNRNSR